MNTFAPIHMQQLPSQQGSRKRVGGRRKATLLSNEEELREKNRRRTCRLSLHSATSRSGGAHLLPSGIMHASPGDCLCACSFAPGGGNKTKDTGMSSGAVDMDIFFFPLRFSENNAKYGSMEREQQDLPQNDEGIHVSSEGKMQRDGPSCILFKGNLFLFLCQ